ncbi:MAG TPA: hypothetical protein VHE99_08500 [Gammaproteobacteria bacterium]|nr:hypothetical protein [Gammaproteobacteria bacterium]
MSNEKVTKISDDQLEELLAQKGESRGTKRFYDSELLRIADDLENQKREEVINQVLDQISSNGNVTGNFSQIKEIVVEYDHPRFFKSELKHPLMERSKQIKESQNQNESEPKSLSCIIS